ncbi:DUF4079 domain-containing protein [Oscillatoria sp. FACHB-1406]|uniref:DUF4079 domain-containing protein n=1 Tax=Oscillatoria sp. FACHB-1406 TaxID=2692846 RepID=UPI0016875571|nr:DUF4079 domain-containing protein [Oscillatoria sp. FACHB-1406]MBD2576608.1 DUF4079 domain-containing protein [Oscillatoria sp. FACHB-1406]
MTFEIPQTVKAYSQFFHPALMWVLLAMTVYALYSGLKIRQTRSADKEVRKELIKKNFTDKHYKVGSILLSLMVAGAIGAMAVTYINNGKIFFGPHLLVGLGMTVAIATSAALVPFMQKGNELARYSHITINVTLLGLFFWQAVSGVEILGRIISKM